MHSPLVYTIGGRCARTTEGDHVSLSSARLEILRCLAFRHSWEALGGLAGVVDGQRCIRWELSCTRDCGTTATEWRDLIGNRIPGTHRQYNYSAEYKQYTGYAQGEYFNAIADRRSFRVNRAG